MSIKNLDRSKEPYPKRTADTIAVSYTRGLEQSGRPSPRRDHSCGDQSRLDSPASCTEHLTGLDLTLVAFEDPSGEDHTQGKGGAKAKHDAIAKALAEGWSTHDGMELK
jgi:hypothetical protein